MRHFELRVNAGGLAVKVFKAMKQFDPAMMMGPTLHLLRTGQPLHVDTNHSERLRVFQNLLKLIDEIEDLGLTYQISLNEGPPEIINGTPVWTPVDGSRDDIVRLIQNEKQRLAERVRAAEFQVDFTPSEPPIALKLLHERWATIEFDDLFPSERRYIHLWWLKVEVENGTFDQYFFNSAGDDALQTLAALQALGASETAAILSDAIALFDVAGGFNADRQERWKQLKEIPDGRFESVTARYYERTEDFLGVAVAELESEYLQKGLISDSQIAR